MNVIINLCLHTLQVFVMCVQIHEEMLWVEDAALFVRVDSLCVVRPTLLADNILITSYEH